jgi:hypothetical protein
MANFGIKSTRPSIDVLTSTDTTQFTSNSSLNTLKIIAEGQGTATMTEDPATYWTWSTTISHNLGYNPLFFGFIGVKAFIAQGMGLDLSDSEATSAATTTWYAQSFIAEITGNIKNVAVVGHSYAATGSEIDYYIFSDSSNTPNSSVGTVGTQTLPADAFEEWIASVLTPASTISLTQGTKYWLVVKNVYKSATKIGAIPYASTDEYSGGKMMRTTDSGTNWSDFGGDMVFRILFDYLEDDTKRRWFQVPGRINSFADDVGAFDFVNIGSGYEYPDANSVTFQIDGLEIDSALAEVDYKYFLCADPSKEAWYE